MNSLDAHYSDPALAALYDIDSGWSIDRDFYRALPDGPETKVLDVGCGTGLITAAIASDGHRVTGVDPAASMLNIAKLRENGGLVDWIDGTLSNVTDNDFDLIFMTGHAFQCILTDADISTFFADVRDRLHPNGRFVFETRNPAIDWATKWTGTRPIDIDHKTIQMSRKITDQSDEQITFVTTYPLQSGAKESESTLRFATHEHLTDLMRRNGLRVTSFWGDWDKTAFDPKTSEEMIFEVRLHKAQDDD